MTKSQSGVTSLRFFSSSSRSASFFVFFSSSAVLSVLRFAIAVSRLIFLVWRLLSSSSAILRFSSKSSWAAASAFTAFEISDSRSSMMVARIATMPLDSPFRLPLSEKTASGASSGERSNSGPCCKKFCNGPSSILFFVKYADRNSVACVSRPIESSSSFFAWRNASFSAFLSAFMSAICSLVASISLIVCSFSSSSFLISASSLPMVASFTSTFHERSAIVLLIFWYSCKHWSRFSMSACASSFSFPMNVSMEAMTSSKWPALARRRSAATRASFKLCVAAACALSAS
mmetsp:Transcript_55432/g.157126  ORF Transcript_55432/g.157126 Transcript_55432/m.157126 type:complete len:289 (-) Transcript_55432:1223-2089(-)